MRKMRLSAIGVVMVLGLVVAACGTGIGASDTTTTSVEVTTTSEDTTTTTAATPSTTTSPTTTTTGGSPTTTSGSPTTTAMRGDRVDLGPPAGAELGVIGVRHNDFLNLRANPGADQRIVEEIPPTYDGLIARGHTRDLGRSFWTQVDYEGSRGWVNMRYVAYIGRTDDTTSQVINDFGERPEASTMAELGMMIAERAASDDPRSDIVMVVKEKGGDLGEVTFDVVGLGDDSVRGVRLHIFAENMDGHFQLRTVEQTLFCDPARGMDADGTCA